MSSDDPNKELPIFLGRTPETPEEIVRRMLGDSSPAAPSTVRPTADDIKKYMDEGTPAESSGTEAKKIKKPKRHGLRRALFRDLAEWVELPNTMEQLKEELREMKKAKGLCLCCAVLIVGATVSICTYQFETQKSKESSELQGDYNRRVELWAHQLRSADAKASDSADKLNGIQLQLSQAQAENRSLQSRIQTPSAGRNPIESQVPTSVTSNNQQGGLTAGVVNIGSQKRTITPEFSVMLLNTVAGFRNVVMACPGDDSEAMAFATEIETFLGAKGYHIEGFVHRLFNVTPIKGLSYSPSGDTVTLTIGSQ